MKTIWFLNHYATNQFIEHGGRHYCFAKYLIRAGYDVKIFCASTIHNTDQNLITDERCYYEDECDGIPFVFVKCRSYVGNGKSRILNMFDFYHNINKTTFCFEKPDVIIGSSVHPLTCVAAIKMGKRYKCRAIAEIRDLWPESIIAYGIKKKSNPIIQALYRLEKWIYTKADTIVFTMEGGRDYIIEKGWDKQTHEGSVDLDKVYHINNGVDLELFDYNREHYQFADSDLDDPDKFKVVYTGSIRQVNQIHELVKVAAMLRQNSEIIFLIWGDGDQVKVISDLIANENLMNIKLKGRVPKEYVPSILARSTLNIYVLPPLEIYKYGISLNKSFEYFASGNPVLSSSKPGYSTIDKYHCGVCLDDCTPESMANAIVRFAHMSKNEYSEYQRNTLLAAQDHDFLHLTEKLLHVIGDNKDGNTNM